MPPDPPSPDPSETGRRPAGGPAVTPAGDDASGERRPAPAAAPVGNGPARRRRGGRPKTAAGEALSVVVVTRLKEREAARVRAEAEAAGLSVGAYVRRRLFGRPVASRVLARSVDTAQVELARVGTNLNQLVRRAHQTAADLERGGLPAGAASGTASGGSSAGATWAAIAAEARSLIGEVRAASRALARAAEGGAGGHVRDGGGEASAGASAPSDPGSR